MTGPKRQRRVSLGWQNFPGCKVEQHWIDWATIVIPANSIEHPWKRKIKREQNRVQD